MVPVTRRVTLMGFASLLSHFGSLVGGLQRRISLSDTYKSQRFSLSLRGISKGYGNHTKILHSINLEVAAGEFVVLFGPSGCGKSTLLRMIAGLESITEGEIAVGGRGVDRVEPKDRNIAMVFQNYALYPHMTVYENMSYGLRIRRMPPAEIRKRVERAA